MGSGFDDDQTRVRVGCRTQTTLLHLCSHGEIPDFNGAALNPKRHDEFAACMPIPFKLEVADPPYQISPLSGEESALHHLSPGIKNY